MELDTVVLGQNFETQMSAVIQTLQQLPSHLPRSILYPLFTPSMPEEAGELNMGWMILASGAKYRSTFCSITLASRGSHRERTTSRISFCGSSMVDGGSVSEGWEGERGGRASNERHQVQRLSGPN